jgi:hypothetical protein
MSIGSGVPPRAGGPDRLDPLSGLWYYPAFAAVVVAGFVGFTALTSAFVTHGFVDQVLVPLVHPVDLRPGDMVEVGGSGGYRPVLVRHADGSVTDTGEMPHHLRFLRGLPAFLATALVWFPCIWVLARWWPKVGAAAHGGTGEGARSAEPLSWPTDLIENENPGSG